jgi:hypothetical protein
MTLSGFQVHRLRFHTQAEWYHHVMICVLSSYREFWLDQSIYLYGVNIQCDLM